MKRIKLVAFMLMLCSACLAQNQDDGKTWKFDLTSKEEGVRLNIDLYEESVEVPGMDIFGAMNGYIGGKVYGVWMVTSFVIKNEKTAVIRFSNDFGSETQECILTHTDDGNYTLELTGGVCVKKVVDKKLVKIKNKHLFEVKK